MDLHDFFLLLVSIHINLTFKHTSALKKNIDTPKSDLIVFELIAYEKKNLRLSLELGGEYMKQSFLKS